jgi:cytochrome c5
MLKSNVPTSAVRYAGIVLIAALAACGGGGGSSDNDANGRKDTDSDDVRTAAVTPITPAPVAATPVTTAPVNTTPVATAPVTPVATAPVTATPVTATPVTATPAVPAAPTGGALGKTLYNQNCVACHSLGSKTASKVSNNTLGAIAGNVGGMGYLSTAIGQAEVNAIALYLANPAAF